MEVVFYLTQRDHGFMKKEGREGECKLVTHSFTPTHIHCGLTSHLLGDGDELMCLREIEGWYDAVK